MRPLYADAWRDIARAAQNELEFRRNTVREMRARGEAVDRALVADGNAWKAIAADWTWYTTHQRTEADDVAWADKLTAIDREIGRYDRLAALGALTASEQRRRDLLEAMRWHTIPRAFGIAFCVATTIEMRRQRTSNDNLQERNAA